MSSLTLQSPEFFRINKKAPEILIRELSFFWGEVNSMILEVLINHRLGLVIFVFSLPQVLSRIKCHLQLLIDQKNRLAGFRKMQLAEPLQDIQGLKATAEMLAKSLSFAILSLGWQVIQIGSAGALQCGVGRNTLDWTQGKGEPPTEHL